MIYKKEIARARMQLHQAAQLLAAIGISFLEKKTDDSHTNMVWDRTRQSLVSSDFGPQNNYTLALSFPQFTYRLSGINSISEFALHGKTIFQSIAWLRNTLQAEGMNLTKFTMEKHYRIPLTEQAKGAVYRLFNKKVFKLLADDFNRAHQIISRISEKYENKSEIRCWPHHFDLARLIVFEKNDNPQLMKSVGLGLSPGDESYDQPYYYVSPWPYPDKSKLKNSDLPGDGFWHSAGFVAAILPAEYYLNYPEIESFVLNFLTTAIEISKKMI